VQLADSGSQGRTNHLRRHGITKHGRKAPLPLGQIKFTTPSDPDNPTLRQSGAYVQLTTTVVRKPFEDALVALVVICQLALSLVVNNMFYDFIKVIFPKVDTIIPRHGNTIRKWIMEAFHRRKQKLKDSFEKCQSNVNFSFDLWTSPNHKGLLGVVAYYIDENGFL
jgi:hypothetical protein